MKQRKSMTKAQLNYKYNRWGTALNPSESIEEISEILGDYDPIQEIKNHLDQNQNDYSDDLRIWIK